MNVSAWIYAGASEGRPDCVWEVPACTWCCTKSTGTTRVTFPVLYQCMQLKRYRFILVHLSSQNLFGKMADVLEKIKKYVFLYFLYFTSNMNQISKKSSKGNIYMCLFVSVSFFLLCVSLFMWVQPESTRKLYICLWVTFITSCVLPYKLMGFMMGEWHATHNHTRLPQFKLIWVQLHQTKTNLFMHSWSTATVCSVSVRDTCRLLASLRNISF